ncbi:MAG: hypothetical protein ACYTF9_10615, partial [Planctomycetota bacterium]
MMRARTILAVAAAALVSTPVLAQDDPPTRTREEAAPQRTTSPDRTAPPTTRERTTARERTADEPAKRAADQIGTAPSRTSPQKDPALSRDRSSRTTSGATPGSAADPNARAMEQMRKAEAKYRQRLAKIKRLRVLAREQGNAERLRALDGLEAKLEALHTKQIAQIRRQLDATSAAKADEVIRRGRGKRASGAGGDEARERAQRARDSATGAAGNMTYEERAARAAQAKRAREAANNAPKTAGDMTDEERAARAERARRAREAREGRGASGGEKTAPPTDEERARREREAERIRQERAKAAEKGRERGKGTGRE